MLKTRIPVSTAIAIILWFSLCIPILLKLYLNSIAPSSPPPQPQVCTVTQDCTTQDNIREGMQYWLAQFTPFVVEVVDILRKHGSQIDFGTFAAIGTAEYSATFDSVNDTGVYGQIKRYDVPSGGIGDSHLQKTIAEVLKNTTTCEALSSATVEQVYVGIDLTRPHLCANETKNNLTIVKLVGINNGFEGGPSIIVVHLLLGNESFVKLEHFKHVPLQEYNNKVLWYFGDGFTQNHPDLPEPEWTNESFSIAYNDAIAYLENELRTPSAALKKVFKDL